MQQQDDPPRHHHRQRAGGVDDLGARRLAAVESIDVERAQVRFDELQKLPRQRNLRGFIRAKQQVDRRHLAGGDLLADVGVRGGANQKASRMALTTERENSLLMRSSAFDSCVKNEEGSTNPVGSFEIELVASYSSRIEMEGLLQRIVSF